MDARDLDPDMSLGPRVYHDDEKDYDDNFFQFLLGYTVSNQYHRLQGVCRLVVVSGIETPSRKSEASFQKPAL